MDARKSGVSCIEARRDPKSTVDRKSVRGFRLVVDHKSALGSESRCIPRTFSWGAVFDGIDARMDPCRDGCCVVYQRCEPKMDPDKEKAHARGHVGHVTNSSIAKLPLSLLVPGVSGQRACAHCMCLCMSVQARGCEQEAP